MQNYKCARPTVSFNAVAQDLALETGSTVLIADHSFTVSKIYPSRDPRNDASVWINLKQGQELLGQPEKINGILALSCLCYHAQLTEIIKDIEQILPGTHVQIRKSDAVIRYESRVRAAQEANDLVKQTYEQGMHDINQQKQQRKELKQEIQAVTLWLIPAILITAVVSIALLAFSNVRQRQTEIAVLRALGFQGQQIMLLFLGKAACIGIVGALEDINLEVNKNEFVVIQEPSGCGKTTLLLTIAGMLKPDTGTAMVIGQDVYALSPNQRADMRAQHIGFVFQQFHLIDYLTVRENILLPSINKHSLDTQELCLKLVKEFDIHDRLEHFPAELSTGQRQRVALARSLINQPQIILADEPIGNLDQANSTIILEQLRAFVQSDGTVLMVTHDNQAAEIADRIVLIQKGIIQ